MDESFDPGEVWDALQDDKRLKKAAEALKKAAEAYLVSVYDALQAMEGVATKEGDDEFLQEVDENRYAFIRKLSETTLHVALEELKAEYVARESEEDGEDELEGSAI